MKRKNIEKTLVAMSHRQKLIRRKQSRAIESAIKFILSTGDADLAWTTGQALHAQEGKVSQAAAVGLMITAALLGEMRALNSSAIVLNQRRSPQWKKKLGLELLLIAANSGDRMAMWNLFVTFKTKDPDRALAWALKSKSNDPADLKMIDRIVKKHGITKTRLKRLERIKPW